MLTMALASHGLFTTGLAVVVESTSASVAVDIVLAWVMARRTARSMATSVSNAIGNSVNHMLGNGSPNLAMMLLLIIPTN